MIHALTIQHSKTAIKLQLLNITNTKCISINNEIHKVNMKKLAVQVRLDGTEK